MLSVRNPQMIITYLEKEAGYKIVNFREIKTNGATNCVYLAVTLINNEEIFVKVGEKVNLEVKNIIYLVKRGVDSIIPILKGTSEEKKILINKLLPQPNAGYDLVKNLYDHKVTLQEFLNFQVDSFNALKLFYKVPVRSKTNYKSPIFIKKTFLSLKKLHEEKYIFFTNNKSKIYLHKILYTPINYLKNGISVNLPSVAEMFNNFKEKMRLVPKISPKVVHGDFHAPNIIKTTNNNVKIIDISDVHYREDPSWDLGKWLNYVKRFYRVAAVRNTRELDLAIKLTCSLKKINLRDNYKTNIRIQRIHNEAIKIFSHLINFDDTDLIELRSAAAEFMVNIYTLRRHAKIYPETVKSILSCICDSYIQFINIKKYKS